MATKMSILSDKDIRTYDNPPIFNSEQRAYFFDLPQAITKQLKSYQTITHKIGFQLLYAYFQARKRFFTSARFHQEDITYLCSKLGLFEFSVDMTQYRKNTFTNQKHFLLNFFGWHPFDMDAKKLAREEIEPMVKSQLRPKLILHHVLSFLEKRRIELPTYHNLSSIILNAIADYKENLMQQLHLYLSDQDMDLLDELLEPIPDERDLQVPRYLITLFKRPHQSTRPMKIKENVKLFVHLKKLFDQTNAIISKLDVNEDAIKYYGDLTFKYDVFQLVRKPVLEKYLHLLAFVCYQYYRWQDTLIETLLMGSKEILNKAQNETSQRYYEAKKAHKKLLHDALGIASQGLGLVELIAQVNESGLSDAEKIEQINLIIASNAAFMADGRKELKEIEKALQQQYSDKVIYEILEEFSVKFQNKASLIIKHLDFDTKLSSSPIVKAIEYFRSSPKLVNSNTYLDFLTEKEQKILAEKPQIQLYKALLFKKIYEAIKAGSLNLTHSYRFRAFKRYLIPEIAWKSGHREYLHKAHLDHIHCYNTIIQQLEESLEDAYNRTNTHILEERNHLLSFKSGGRFKVTTPNKEESTIMAEPFPKHKIIALSEVLHTIHQTTKFIDVFVHTQPRYAKKRPDENVFIAGIMGYGCNIGIRKMGKITQPISPHELENVAEWYLSLENIEASNQRILDYLDEMELPNIFRKAKEGLRTSSDGQKIDMAVESLNASYSYKYFGKGKGVSSYSFVDERYLQFYSTIISASEREATYVIDGLLHTDAIKSTQHSTDTHGYTEAIFATMYLLGFDFAPRIARLDKQKIYSFGKMNLYKSKNYKVLPDGNINTDLIEENWDTIIQMITSIKLKTTSASQVFKRLNSYSKQHTVYQALKELGKIIKSIFVLRYIDDVQLRQSIQEQLNKIENSNQFSKAIFFGNGGKMIYPTHQEQLIAEGCKRLIKNTIICWNYLYLTNEIENESQPEKKQQILDALKAGSAMSWEHIHLEGFYDLSEENLKDSFDLKPLKKINV